MKVDEKTILASDFVCVGFDIRILVPPQGYTADAIAWDQEKSIYEKALYELGLKENLFQLIQTESPEEINNLIDFINESEGVKLIAIEVPSILCECMWGGCVEAIPLDKHLWISLGFDVCDSNGFFSILHMEILKNKKFDLYNQTNLIDAFALTQTANILVPEHSPFVVVQIWECK